MANDIDLWEDMVEAEKVGDKERAEHLHKLFVDLFIEDNPMEDTEGYK